MRSTTSPRRRGLRPLLPLILLSLPALQPLPAEGAQAASSPSPGVGELTRFELLGEAVVPSAPPASEQLDAPVGGLSGLRYDPATGTYLALSDDGAERGPARFYRLEIDLGLGAEAGAEGPHLAADGARVVDAVELLDAGDRPFAPKTVDPEGIAIASASSGQSLYVSSEGRVNRGAPPFVRRYGLDGRRLGELVLPAYFLPGEGVGVRHNLAFESLTVAPGGGYLFTASENALAQDGPEATVASGSPSRLLRWELAADGSALGVPTEWVYPTDPVAEPPLAPDALQVAGLVELLAVGPETLLSLERSYTDGVGTAVKLYRVSLAGATPVTGRPSLADLAAEDLRPAAKTLLLDLTEVLAAADVPIDNLEGLTFGPDLPDDRRTLLLISDDNFNDHQRTQVLAFAVSGDPVSVAAVQGRGHRSPLEGEWVRGVRGVVTAVDPGRQLRFFVQDADGDGDPGTAEGLAVRPRKGEAIPTVGELVGVAGQVEERGFPGALTVTTLTGARITSLGEAPLPAPIVLGGTGRRLPGTVIDDDGLTEYDPIALPGEEGRPGKGADGIDVWESLEGMRVEVPEPVVVGPSTSYGGFVVVPDGGTGASLRSSAGGLVARPEDFNPERILVDTAFLPEAPELWVGDHLSAPLTGVVDYSFSNFQLLATEPIPRAFHGGQRALGGPGPAPPPPDGALTLATYNVLNLHPGVGERMDRLAASIVEDLGSPDLVALQEVQDATGPADDGVVAGAPTFERLIAAIEAAGGPTYAFRQIDPIDGTEGGQPGGNIRVGFLVREDRLELPPAPDGAPAPGPATAVEIRTPDGTPHLAPNPGRVAPEHPCFSGFSTGGRDDYEPTRRSLAIELRHGARTLFVIDNHWKSKRGDGRLFGAVQPPVLWSEEQRICQARVIADFVRELLAADPDAWVIVLGDLNEHELRPPVQELEAAGLTDLIWRIPQAERYSYNFEGNSQVLDHILVSPAVLRESVVLPAIVHVNTDRPASLAASDHDPVRVILVPTAGRASGAPESRPVP